MNWLLSTIQMAGAENRKIFMPPQGTEIAADVDNLYLFLNWASFISCAILIGGMIFFVIKYRRRSDNDKTPYISHNSFLEFLWSFIPLVIFLAMFGWGWYVYHKMRTMPDNALEVHVFGQKWSWDYAYKSGKTVASDMVVPVNTNVKLIMTSRDVLHSYFIPSMRIKQDVIPGRYTAQWFRAEKIGDYNVFCAEYCGDKHSNMLGKVRVVTMPEYEQWIQENDNSLPLVERGNKLYMGRCVACHTTDGRPNVGPTWKGLFGSANHEIQGGTVTVDENYLQESILNPNAKIAANPTSTGGKEFKAGVMPTFQGQLKPEEVSALIEYIKTLK